MGRCRRCGPDQKHDTGTVTRPDELDAQSIGPRDCTLSEGDSGDLILLCQWHHTAVHEGGITITGTPCSWLFTKPDGQPASHGSAIRTSTSTTPSAASKPSIN